VVAIGAVWLVSPAGVPLYDGIGFPDEPYRYVDPPAGSKPTKPATDAVDRVPVDNGTSKLIVFAKSDEQGPQVTVSMPSRAMAAPRASAITVRATPEAPDSQPSGVTFDGNVYAVSITADRGSVTTTDRLSQAYMLMRATTGQQPGPTMYYRAAPTDDWQALHTVRVGTDIYQSPVRGSGDYALAFANEGAGGSNATSLLIVLVVALLIVFGVLMGIRLRRSGASAPTGSTGSA
jgi:hypothetical protein